MHRWSVRDFPRFVLLVSALAHGWAAGWIATPVWAGAAESGEAAGDTPPGEKRPAAKVTRADLSVAYLRFEQTMGAHPVPAERTAEINRAFDQATLAFFAGRNAATIETINQLAASLLPEPPSAAQRVAASLRVTIEPAVLHPASEATPIARVESLYAVAVEPAQSIRLVLRLRLLDGAGQVELPIEIEAGPATLVDRQLDLADLADSLSAGTLALELVTDQGQVFSTGQWVVATRPLDAVREANFKRLADLRPETPALQQALATCLARNSLLTDRPSSSKSAELLADPTALAAEVSAEIDALLAQRDPYARRAGDYWRVVKTPKTEIPLRVYAPQAATGEQPVGLLIALHGAGGDENMFFYGYGAGMIKRLADEHGLIVVTPRTEALAAKPEHLDTLLEALAYDYAIDPSRVYVLGHSMGAGATASLAGRSPEKIRAAACLAGFAGFSKKVERIPPLLVIAAELDPIIPPEQIEPSATKAAERGLPVEFRLKRDYGHTLLVPAVLGEAVQWMLAQ